MNAISTLQQTVTSLQGQFDEILPERKNQLKVLSDYLRTRSESSTALLFVCTHNSRRSHIAAIWAGMAARLYGQQSVVAYSAGTEVTAFNPKAVGALRRAGFPVSGDGLGENPRYTIDMDGKTQAYFSKRYNDASIKGDPLAAIMVCTDADENCPVIPNAAFRLPLPYIDPKAWDGTIQEGDRYDASVREIGREMLYVFSLVAEQPLP
jgi:hypothetical protein